MNRRAAAICAASFALLVVIAFGTTGWIRGSLGDLVVVIWVASAVSIVGPLVKRPGVAVGFAVGLATTLELLQLLGRVDADSPLWAHLVFGSTFDPWDLVHYAVGGVLAYGLLAISGAQTA